MPPFTPSQSTKAAVLHVLQRHIGKRNGVTADQLVREMRTFGALDMNARYFRALVEELRLDGHHICAHPQTGYYVAETAEELDESCEYLYSRAMCSLRQVARMRGVAEPDLRGQLRLPT